MTREPTLPAVEDEGLGPPQFSLISLLVAITAVSIIFASYQLLGAAAAFILALLTVAVAAHVIGNSLGTRLRDIGNASKQVAHAGVKQRGDVSESDLAPVTRLHHVASLGRPLVVCTGIGAVAGLISGLLLFVWANWEQASWSASSLGVAAFIFLGGFFGFLLSSFLQVGMDALVQAHDAEKVDHSE